MRDRFKVKKTVPAQGTLETKHFEKTQQHNLTHATHWLSQS